MNGKNSVGIFTILSLAIALQGCTQPANSNTAKDSNTNRFVKVSTANSNNTAPDATTVFEANNSGNPNANSASASSKQSVSPASNPAPKISSGATDMSLFMQVRNKLSSDKDLINSVIVEIKEGNVTLTGQVSNEEQKKKAEQLIQNVQGIKSVKNNLRISS